MKHTSWLALLFLGAATSVALAQSADPAPGPALATPAPPAAAPTAPAEAPGVAARERSIDEQVQELKKNSVELNRDLAILEEELMYPASTQVAVFVSMDVGEFFTLDSVTVKVDGKEVSNYLYTPREIAALVKGGVQKLYIGNVKAGDHEIVAFFEGKGPHDRYYRRGASAHFVKEGSAKYLELKITDHARSEQPEFEIKDWE